MVDLVTAPFNAFFLLVNLALLVLKVWALVDAAIRPSSAFVAASRAVFPYFSRQVAIQDFDSLKATLRLFVWLIGLVTLGATIVLVVCAPMIVDLLFRGTFGYTEWGHRDATHLRWFTRNDMTQLLSEAGWGVEAVHSSAEQRLHELRVRMPRRIVFGLPGEFLTKGWFLLARTDRTP